jgi:hypothetical protein
VSGIRKILWSKRLGCEVTVTRNRESQPAAKQETTPPQQLKTTALIPIWSDAKKKEKNMITMAAIYHFQCVLYKALKNIYLFHSVLKTQL